MTLCLGLIDFIFITIVDFVNHTTLFQLCQYGTAAIQQPFFKTEAHTMTILASFYSTLHITHISLLEQYEHIGDGHMCSTVGADSDVESTGILEPSNSSWYCG